MTQNRYGLTGVQLWPTMIFTRLWEQSHVENPLITQCIGRLKASQQQRIDSGVAVSAKSAHGIFESDFDLLKHNDPSLQRLSQFIQATLAAAVCVANGGEKRPDALNVDIVESWYHVTNQHGFHDAHVHHGCSWCGIYYVCIGAMDKSKGDGAPNGGSRFYCPFNLGGGYRDYGNKYLGAFADPPVENGLLLLFPSFLLHSGLPYVGNEDRIVIAFNARVHLNS